MKKSKILHLVTMVGLSVYLVVGAATPAQAMHIAEGFLPVQWAVFWWILALPFFLFGLRSLSRITKEHSELKLLLALVGSFTFVLSALKIPSVTGSASHPTGTGLGAILFGASVMAVLGSLVLLFQALLLAHGGLTTLGANMFSMAIAGPLIAYGVYHLLLKTGNQKLAIFVASALANLLTYIITSIQLALAFPRSIRGIFGSIPQICGYFCPYSSSTGNY